MMTQSQPLDYNPDILDLLQYGVWISNSTHQITYANPAMLAIAGGGADQLVGVNVLEFPEDAIHSFRGYFAYACESMTPLKYDCFVITLAGRESWLGGWLTPLIENGAYAGMLCTAEDITENKQQERHLITSGHRLEMALQVTGLGLWDVDIPSRTAVYDKQWCSMLGYEVEEVGTDMASWERLIHPDDLPAVRHAVEQHLNGAIPLYEAEHRLRHKAGHWVWIASAGKIVSRDNEGNPLRIIGTHHDISDQRRLKVEGTELLRQIESLISGIGNVREGSVPRQSSQPKIKKNPLSNRQCEVIALVADGLTSTEIATRLHITHATVLAHRRDIMGKLGIHSTAELTRYAIRNKLVAE
jgi:PAS domain S-box-containing protein